MSGQQSLRVKFDSVGSLKDSLWTFAQDIKIHHSVFALPFALSSFWFAQIGWPGVWKISLILSCMVFARSFAMGMNRILDNQIDALNPRTSSRMIPAGNLSVAAASMWSLLSLALFVLCSFLLSDLAGRCSFGVAVLLGCYPLLKRVHWLTHWYLGFCLGLAPIAICVALDAPITLSVLLIAVATASWTAGFDIIYSLQDLVFDRGLGLKSVPGQLGVATALRFSRLNFLVMVSCLVVAGWLAGKGEIYFLGILILAILLAFEHWLIRGTDEQGQSKWIGVAFFQVNAMVSILFLLITVVDDGVRGF